MIPLRFRLKDALKTRLINYYSELERAVGEARSLLDLGCGSDSPIKYFKKRIEFTVGVDGFEPSITESRRKGIHDDYHVLNILEIDRKFKEDSFDCVLASDVIEHLTKEQGLRLIDQMEKISRERVVIFTPNSFLPQEEHSENPFQRHLSGWTVQKMRQLGYEVIGIKGWKPLRGELSKPRFRPRFFWGLISYLTQSLVRNHPEHAFQLLCVKYQR